MKRTEAQAAEAACLAYEQLNSSWVSESATGSVWNVVPRGPAYYDNTGWHDAPSQPVQK